MIRSLVILAIGFLVLGGRPLGQDVDSTVWRTGPEVNLRGRVSPDGRFLAFVEGTGGSGNVALRDLRNGRQRLLTYERSSTGYPGTVVFSPKGDQVAFYWADNDEFSVGLLRIDESAPPRWLIRRTALHYRLSAWSPVQQQLVAQEIDYRQRTYHIVLISALDGSVRRLKSTGTRVPEIGDFSVDGRFVFYAVASTAGQADGGLFTLAVDGGEVPLLQDTRSVGRPWLTPNGRSLVFASDRSSQNGLWSLLIANGRADGPPVLLRPVIGNVTGLGFSPDGSYYYGSTQTDSDVYTATFDATTLRATNALRLSPKTPGVNTGASWSPDGRQIAFARRDARGAVTLVVRTLDTGAERVVQTTVDNDAELQGNFRARWFPDNRSLLVAEFRSQNRWIVRQVDVETGAGVIVLEDTPGTTSLYGTIELGPSGRVLYYTRAEPTDRPNLRSLRLIRRDLDTGADTELYKVDSPGVGLFGLTMSPNGGRLAFTVNGSEADAPRSIVSVSAENGSALTVFRGGPGSPIPTALAWTKDSRHLIAVFSEDSAGAEPPVMHLVAVPVGGGAPTRLGLAAERFIAPEISPAGDRLLYTAVVRRNEVRVARDILSASSLR